MGDEIFIIAGSRLYDEFGKNLRSALIVSQLAFLYGLSFPGWISQLFTVNGKNGTHAATFMEWEIHLLSSSILLS